MIFLTNHLFVEYFMFSSILAVINNASVNVPCKLSWIFKIVYCKEQQLYGTLTSLIQKDVSVQVNLETGSNKQVSLLYRL